MTDLREVTRRMNVADIFANANPIIREGNPD
jgi:hypothetical protein